MIALGDRTPFLVPAGDVFQLDAEDRTLKAVHARVPPYLVVMVATPHSVLPQHAQANRDEIATALRHRIKTLIGISTKVDVGAPESIERTLVGKAKRVVDQRRKG